MQPEAMAVAQRRQVCQRIDGAPARGAQGRDHRGDVAAGEPALQRGHVEAPARVHRHRLERQTEHAAETLVGVVGIHRREHHAIGPAQPARHPQRFQVGQGAASGEMAEMGRPADHGGEPGHRVALHERTRPAAIEGMIVRVDQHGQGIGQPRHRVGRLEHLPGVERMEVRVVVRQPRRRFHEHRFQGPGRRRAGGRRTPGRQILEAGAEPPGGGSEHVEFRRRPARARRRRPGRGAPRGAGWRTRLPRTSIRLHSGDRPSLPRGKGRVGGWVVPNGSGGAAPAACHTTVMSRR